MSQLQDRINQFRKMAADDPENELGHYRLGQLLLEDHQFADAVASFKRTLELSPQFSKVYQLMGKCLLELNRKSEALDTLKKGYAVADERGDNLPREEMAKMLEALGEKPPETKKPAAGPGTGFRCQRPGCYAGAAARQLESAPVGFDKDLGERIHQTICQNCWLDWLRSMSIKVINELRLDLSTERGADEYDRHMREYLGLE